MNLQIATGRRIVTLNEIIPTLYRYQQENYGVTIIDRNGKIVTRFDGDTENICNVWNDRNTSDAMKENFMDYLNTNVLGYLQKHNVTVQQLGSLTAIENLFGRIYGQMTSGTALHSFSCDWKGNETWIAKRVDADLLRCYCLFSISY